MKRNGFQLRVLPRPGGEYGVALCEVPGVRRGVKDEEPKQVVRVWGTPFTAMLDRTLQAVKASGSRPSALRRDRAQPFTLDEETGVRLGLLYHAVKPMRKLSRISAIGQATAAMGLEEAYYWYAKCSDPQEGRRARRAFRILMAER